MNEDVMKVITKIQGIAQEYLDLYANEGDQFAIEFEQYNAPTVSEQDSFNVLKNGIKQFSINQLGEVSFNIKSVTHSDIVGIAMMTDVIAESQLVGKVNEPNGEE